MRQQINLYQRTRRAQLPVSAQSLLLVSGMVLVVLLSIWSYGQLAVTRLQHQVDLLQQQRQVQANMVNSASARYGEKIDPATLQQQLTQLTQTLQNRQQALALLRIRTPVMSQGFANRIAALAHPHVDGVWLEGVTLDNTPGIQSLSGRSLNPALVAGYLRALSAEPALAGTRFNNVRILGPKYVDEAAEISAEALSQSTTVRFRVDNNTAVGSAT